MHCTTCWHREIFTERHVNSRMYLSTVHSLGDSLKCFRFFFAPVLHTHVSMCGVYLAKKIVFAGKQFFFLLSSFFVL
jgi:hypothetical protein